MLKRLYLWVLSWAETPYAQPMLFFLSFIESFIFPIPPDVLLMPLCLGDRFKALRFALIATLASVAGALVGYFIGYVLWWSEPDQFSSLALWFFHYIPGFSEHQFHKVKALYEAYNFWIVLVAAFTPIPFKVITVTAGAFNVPFVLFIVAAGVGRSARFFLVAGLLRLYGSPIKQFMDRYFNLLTVLFILMLVGGFVGLKFIF